MKLNIIITLFIATLLSLGCKNKTIKIKQDLPEFKEANLVLAKEGFAAEWHDRYTKIESFSIVSPNELYKADKVLSSTVKNGYISRGVDNIEGGLEFSVWAKGEGQILLLAQGLGGNYTKYMYKLVDLTREWKKYKVNFYKNTDGHRLQLVIGQIQEYDEVFLWNPELLAL